MSGMIWIRTMDGHCGDDCWLMTEYKGVCRCAASWADGKNVPGELCPGTGAYALVMHEINISSRREDDPIPHNVARQLDGIEALRTHVERLNEDSATKNWNSALISYVDAKEREAQPTDDKINLDECTCLNCPSVTLEHYYGVMVARCTVCEKIKTVNPPKQEGL